MHQQRINGTSQQQQQQQQQLPRVMASDAAHGYAASLMNQAYTSVMGNPKASEAGAHNVHPSYLGGHASGYPMSAAGLYLPNSGHFYDRNNIPTLVGSEDLGWMSHAASGDMDSLYGGGHPALGDTTKSQSGSYKKDRRKRGVSPPRPTMGRQRVDWSKGEAAERMKKAIEECRNIGNTGSGSWRSVARKYGISWAVLYPRLNGKIAVDASLGAKSTLTREMETKLFEHCCKMAQRGNGLDWIDVKRIAQKMAKMAGFPNFKATDGWVRQFQFRFPELKRYKTESPREGKRMVDDSSVSTAGSKKPRKKYFLHAEGFIPREQVNAPFPPELMAQSSTDTHDMDSSRRKNPRKEVKVKREVDDTKLTGIDLGKLDELLEEEARKASGGVEEADETDEHTEGSHSYYMDDQSMSMDFSKHTKQGTSRDGHEIRDPESPVRELLERQGFMATTAGSKKLSLATMKAFVERYHLPLPLARKQAKREDYVEFLRTIAMNPPPGGWTSDGLSAIESQHRPALQPRPLPTNHRLNHADFLAAAASFQPPLSSSEINENSNSRSQKYSYTNETGMEGGGGKETNTHMNTSGSSLTSKMSSWLNEPEWIKASSMGTGGGLDWTTGGGFQTG